MQIQVYYEDTDCGGIVYHTNYLKYCERARSQWFFDANLLPNNQEVGFVVKNMQIDFLQSAKLGDKLQIHTKILELKSASILLEQSIFLEHKKIFFAKLTLVFINQKGKITKIPQWAKEVFIKAQKSV